MPQGCQGAENLVKKAFLGAINNFVCDICPNSFLYFLYHFISHDYVIKLSKFRLALDIPFYPSYASESRSDQEELVTHE